MAHAISYQAAIEWALDSYRDWHDQHERVAAKWARGEGGQELCRLMERTESKLAAETCGEQYMICRIYGVSEEKVHDDLEALLARDNELVYV